MDPHDCGAGKVSLPKGSTDSSRGGEPATAAKPSQNQNTTALIQARWPATEQHAFKQGKQVHAQHENKWWQRSMHGNKTTRIQAGRGSDASRIRAGKVMT